MNNYAEGPEIPLGFGMALAQNEAAMEQFARLPEEEKQALLSGARGVGSAREMKEYVNSIVSRGE